MRDNILCSQHRRDACATMNFCVAAIWLKCYINCNSEKRTPRTVDTGDFCMLFNRLPISIIAIVFFTLRNWCVRTGLTARLKREGAAPAEPQTPRNTVGWHAQSRAMGVASAGKALNFKISFDIFDTLRPRPSSTQGVPPDPNMVCAYWSNVPLHRQFCDTWQSPFDTS